MGSKRKRQWVLVETLRAAAAAGLIASTIALPFLSFPWGREAHQNPGGAAFWTSAKEWMNITWWCTSWFPSRKDLTFSYCEDSLEDSLELSVSSGLLQLHRTVSHWLLIKAVVQRASQFSSNRINLNRWQKLSLGQHDFICLIFAFFPVSVKGVEELIPRALLSKPSHHWNYPFLTLIYCFK